MRMTCITCRQPEDRRKKVRLHFETICGIMVYREVKGRQLFSARCPACGHTYEINGGKA